MRKPTREQAIKIIEKATDQGDFDDWWADMMDDFGLYDEEADTFPSIFEVFEALGVSKDEVLKAIGAS